MIIVFMAGVLAAMPCAASSRYFYGGDGTLHIRSGKSGAIFSGRYRDTDGSYIVPAIDKINQIFGAQTGMIEPRLIEFLDYLQDAMKGGQITIVSGYRSPTYNTSLRGKGRLAGKASMHQYGMAADIRMAGVHPEKIWHVVRELGYGGVGYYHGANVHVDVGPPRFWDETSSKVDTDHADDNKLITLIQDRDIYAPGDEIALRFVRMTAYPIGIDQTFVLENRKGDEWKATQSFAPQPSTPSSGVCPAYANIAELGGFRWIIPANIKPARYRVRASFCEKEWEAMPNSIASYEFIVEEK